MNSVHVTGGVAHREGRAAVADAPVARKDTVTAGRRTAHVLLVLAAMALAGWTRTLPLRLAPLDDYARLVVPQASASVSLASADASARDAFATALKAELEYRGADNRLHVFLGDSDSYYWLRMARNLLRTGSVCDAWVNGRCWDNLARAPLGRPHRYPHSLHVLTIAALHQLIIHFEPGYPLPATAFWVPVIIGILGVLPAFAIGSRLGGPIGGFLASIIIGMNPVFLDRSIGSDNDVWNVVIPIVVLWAIMTALISSRKTGQIAYSLLAALSTALYASTWAGWIFIYWAILAGLMVDLLLHSLYVTRTRLSVGRDIARTALVTATFGAATAIAVALTADSALNAIVGLYHQFPVLGISKLTQVRSSLWPQPFTGSAINTVNELAPLDLTGIANAFGGHCYLILGYLGLLIMMMPPIGWTLRHYGLFSATLLLDTTVVSIASTSAGFALTLLSLGPIVAILHNVYEDPHAVAEPRAVKMIIAVWFVTGMFLTPAGSRFVIIVLPAFGFSCAVALNSVQRWMAGATDYFTSLNSIVVNGLCVITLAQIVAFPIFRGLSAARSYIPAMNVAWWEVLSGIREQSPTDSIVVSWWDYGYWTEYVSERRVLADGGSLRSHNPYWIAKALLAASEEQTVGLLRILECGSDTTAAGERGDSAYADLHGLGLSEITANDAVLTLAHLDINGARGYLSQLGLSSEAAEKVIRASHCSPPPSYLVLSSRLNDVSAWRYFGNWDFRRALVVARSRDTADGAKDPGATQLGFDRSVIRTPFQEARALKTPTAAEDFISPSDGLLVNHWLSCVRGQDELVCPIEARAGVEVARGVGLTAVVVHFGTPPRASMRIIRAGVWNHRVRVNEVSPGRLLVATDGQLNNIAYTESPYPDTAIIFDAAKRRVLVGPQYLIESTFTRLMFLGETYLKFFDRVDDRLGYGDERVRVWKIDWNWGTRLPHSKLGGGY